MNYKLLVLDVDGSEDIVVKFSVQVMQCLKKKKYVLS